MGKSFNTGKLVNNLNVLDNGNVGIGTSSFSPWAAGTLVLRVQQTSGLSVIQAVSGDGGSGICLYSGASSSDNPAIISLKDIRFGTATDLGTGGFNERMRITSTGNVGIGTSNPLVKFQITQPNGISLPTLGTSTGGLFIAGDGNQYGLYIGNDGNTGNSWLQAMRNNTATSYNILLNPVGGNVGIGISSPSYRLETLATSSSMAAFATTSASGGFLQFRYNTSSVFGYIGSGNQLATGSAVTDFAIANDAGNIVFATGGSFTERIRITSGGNVGIGTTSPNFTLDVNGRMRANGITSSTGSVSSVYSGTAYGIINVTTRGIYYIFAQLPAGTGDVTNYTSMVIVLSDGSAAKIVANYSAPLLPLTLSGTLISVSQNSGALQPSIVWNFTSQN